MADMQEKNVPAAQSIRFLRDWRFTLIIGLSVGFGLPIANAVETNLEPSLGGWGAFGIGLLTAAAVGGLIGLVGGLWLKRRAGSRMEAQK
ncbi:MAG: hypothetical protein ACREIV_10800 [Planctomycetaceae bacterium]